MTCTLYKMVVSTFSFFTKTYYFDCSNCWNIQRLGGKANGSDMLELKSYICMSVHRRTHSYVCVTYVCSQTTMYVCMYIYLNQLWRGRAIMIHAYNQRHKLATYIKASCYYSPNFYYFSIVPLDFSLCLGICRSSLLELVCKK